MDVGSLRRTRTGRIMGRSVLNGDVFTRILLNWSMRAVKSVSPVINVYFTDIDTFSIQWFLVKNHEKQLKD